MVLLNLRYNVTQLSLFAACPYCCVCLDNNFRVDEEIVRRDHTFLEDDAVDALFRCVVAFSLVR